MKKKKSYMESIENLLFLNIDACHKSGKKLDCSGKFNFSCNQLDAVFLDLSLAQANTKAKQLKGQQ